MIDAAGKAICPGDVAVGDDGKVYVLLEEQYDHTQTAFIRVAWVRCVRGELKWDSTDVHGQHANTVVKITREEATGHKDVLRRIYRARRHSVRGMLLERKRRVGRLIRLYEGQDDG